jgi:hypothetical protein
VTFARNVDAIVVSDYVNAKRAKKSKRAITQRWQLPPGVGVEANGDMLSLVSGDQRLDVAKAGVGDWNITSARSGSNVGWFTGNWGERVPGAVLARNANIKKKKSNDVMVTVFVPRNVNESVSVDIRGDAVVVTRNGTPVEIALPTPGPRQR